MFRISEPSERDAVEFVLSQRNLPFTYAEVELRMRRRRRVTRSIIIVRDWVMVKRLIDALLRL